MTHAAAPRNPDKLTHLGPIGDFRSLLSDTLEPSNERIR